MSGDFSFGLVLTILVCAWRTGKSFKDGAPFDMCKYKGNAFHTTKYSSLYVRWIQPMETFNIPSPYKLTAEKLTYREYVNRTVNGKIKQTPDMIKVTLSVLPAYGIDHYKGFYIKAIPLHRADSDPRAYGTFAVVDDKGRFAVKNKDAETVLCYVLHWYSDKFPIGGVSHINNTDKKEMSVYWFPPKNCNIGKVTFEATVVYNYSVYWSNVHSQTLEPEGFGQRTYPACEYYRDPKGYFKKLENLRIQVDSKVKNTKPEVQPVVPGSNTQKDGNADKKKGNKTKTKI